MLVDKSGSPHALLHLLPWIAPSPAFGLIHRARLEKSSTRSASTWPRTHEGKVASVSEDLSFDPAKHPQRNAVHAAARLVDRDRASLAVELLQNGGPKFVAVDRLRQIALKARRTHASLKPCPARAMAGARRPCRTCMRRSRSRNSLSAASAEARSHTMTSAMRAMRMASTAPVAVMMASG